ncbi:DUF2029 domain-containing protein [Sphingomonas baiyangensis]|uniref:DUF2029 domain-containing protein n=1 Tax=Sphingomonas baiyangensis TaxID=2572576 RepID=A0A4U1L2L4_9SPHN|nr:DUF2029 domain-containing protein [Sphingomonas baiyangensis]TKD50423.1 DUF2029 domain-containing protein [Sphingomonas baiyangensis]
MAVRLRPLPALLVLFALFAALAMARPVDHDESQYVAAAILARDWLPYRDFAYLQPPLQPWLFAPLAALFGEWAWPGLRLVNALLAAATVACTWLAAIHAGASRPAALAAAALLACCDALLFSGAMARNDALPGALLAGGIALALAPRASAGSAFGAGLLFAAAAAAKVSFALPAIAFGIHALFARRHSPGWIALGALLPTLLVAFAWTLSPAGFTFGVFDFPARAPADFYVARPWKLSLAAKAIDAVKFLALGPALLAILLAARHRTTTPAARLLDLLVVAGLIAALLPTPTWRQYLLPALPPLFARLALAWTHRPPGRGARIAAIVFACAGLAPSIEAMLSSRPAMPRAMRDSAAIARALDDAGVRGPVASLAPQYLAASGRPPDRRFAAGPFAWRSPALLSPRDQQARRIVTPPTLAAQFGPRGIWGPAAILIGGEAEWSAGDPALDRPLEAWAQKEGWRRVALTSPRFRLYVPR